MRRLRNHPPSPTHLGRSFTKFSKLPKELRLTIWEYAIPESRVIEVLYNRKASKYYTDTIPPVLLHVNAEAREVALKCYSILHLKWPVKNYNIFKLMAGEIFPQARKRKHGLLTEKTMFITYIDYRRDTLYVSHSIPPFMIFKLVFLNALVMYIRSGVDTAISNMKTIAIRPMGFSSGTRSLFEEFAFAKVAYALLNMNLERVILVFGDDLVSEMKWKHRKERRVEAFHWSTEADAESRRAFVKFQHKVRVFQLTVQFMDSLLASLARMNQHGTLPAVDQSLKVQVLKVRREGKNSAWSVFKKLELKLRDALDD